MSGAAAIDGRSIAAWLAQASRSLHDQRESLTELDRVRGDADHGANVDKGFEAAAAAAASQAADPPSEVLLAASAALGARMGGTSGPLWRAALRRMARSLGDAPAVEWPDFAAALLAGVEAMADLGDAREGDNTMIDVLLPAGRELAGSLEAGGDPAEAVERATAAAREHAQESAERPALKGRAAYLGERVVGTVDPGCASAAIIVSALAAAAAGVTG
ncbi:MAG TPA: dihydroxyacetone kinase subunit DhaL [Solirubrobacteraceae bacterium]|nr:dihydroxyacetone kinase subunit DhaL [Solirubrobacteraceae bacterium]